MNMKILGVAVLCVLSLGEQVCAEAWIDLSDFAGDVQAAVDALPALGGGLFCPPGTWTVSAPVVVAKPVMVFGLAGHGGCVIRQTGAGDVFAVALDGDNYVAASTVAFRNVRLVPGASGYGITVRSQTRAACGSVLVDQVQITGGLGAVLAVDACQVRITNTLATEFTGVGLTFANSHIIDGGLYHVTNSQICSVRGDAFAVLFRSGSALYMSNSYFCGSGNASAVFRMDWAASGSHLVLQGNTFEGQGGQEASIVLTNAAGMFYDVMISNNTMAGPARGISISGRGEHHFAGVVIMGNSIQSSASAEQGPECITAADVNGIAITGNVCNTGRRGISTPGTTNAVVANNAVF